MCRLELECDQLAISSGEATLLDVVKALGEYLTSEEDAFRTRGMSWRCSGTFLLHGLTQVSSSCRWLFRGSRRTSSISKQVSLQLELHGRRFDLIASKCTSWLCSFAPSSRIRKQSHRHSRVSCISSSFPLCHRQIFLTLSTRMSLVPSHTSFSTHRSPVCSHM